MAHEKSTRMRIKLGSLELEFEGDDDFLRGEVPKLLAAANDLQVIRIGSSLDALTKNVEEGRGAQAEMEKLFNEARSALDSLNELSETQQLRLQMVMDRMSKAFSTLSNIMKKMSDTAEQITQNIK
jgi:hypothetical protein